MACDGIRHWRILASALNIAGVCRQCSIHFRIEPHMLAWKSNCADTSAVRDAAAVAKVPLASQ